MPNRDGGPVIVVSLSADKADHIASRLHERGFGVAATTDIGWALDETPSVLILHTEGWESTARAMLGGFEMRDPPPPAVILVGEDETAKYVIGPSMAFIREPIDIDELAEAVKLCRAKRAKFVPSWPKMLNLKRLGDFRGIENILETRTGITIRNDWKLSFQNALQERMVANMAPTVADYATILNSSRGAEEIHILACHIAVGETYFWRYSGQMNSLKSLLAARHAANPDESMKIWSAGCSTGEEPYSILMAAIETLGKGADITVIGTDINPLALATARTGSYTPRSLRNLPARLMGRFFDKKENGHVIKEDLKKRVRFEYLNINSPETSRWIKENGPFDAIFCRNVTIYFSHQTARKVVETIASALKMGGGLFLGSSETIHPPLKSVTITQTQGAFHYVKTGETKETPPVGHKETKRPAREHGEPPKVSDEDYETVYHEGLDAVGREDNAVADKLFAEILKANPHSARGNTGLALLLANQGREVEARSLLTGVISRGNELPETHFLLGILDERAQSPETALAHYRKTLKLDPAFFMAHINTAWIMKRLGNAKASSEEMKKALTILKSINRIPAWVTGGLGLEAIFSMVADASEDSGDQQ